MTYSQPLGPGALTRADITSSPAEDASPYASPYASDTADTADVAQTDAPSTDYAQPYGSDGLDRPLGSDDALPGYAGAGTPTDYVDDLGGADEAGYDEDGHFYANYDTDGDGQLDKGLRDKDGDGRIDEYLYDRNEDGRVDLVARDTNDDGHIDYAAIDTDYDGRVDAVYQDTDYDGHYDSVEYP